MLLRCLIRSRETMQLGKAYPGEGRHYVLAGICSGSRAAGETQELALAVVSGTLLHAPPRKAQDYLA
jgi:hypothetical protein